MNVIETQELCCHFGSTRAVDGVSLTVPKGSIYGLLGPNGAGKSTTIKSLLGLNRPTRGSALVLGTEGRKLKSQHFEKIAYISEDQQLHRWYTVRQMLAYCAPLYPTWDHQFADQLIEQFELPKDRRIRALSRGMRMKLCLVLALAFRPEVLLLDEPFSGLDPVVREDVIEGIMELTDQENWTVLMSSHDMEEVERLADRIGVLKNGKLVADEGVESIQERFRRVEASYDGELPKKLPDSWLRVKQAGRRIEFVHRDYSPDSWGAELTQYFGGKVEAEVQEMSLRDIYLAIARSQTTKG